MESRDGSTNASFELLNDDVLLQVLLRCNGDDHSALGLTCKRLREMLLTSKFQRARAVTEWAETKAISKIRRKLFRARMTIVDPDVTRDYVDLIVDGRKAGSMEFCLVNRRNTRRFHDACGATSQASLHETGCSFFDNKGRPRIASVRDAIKDDKRGFLYISRIAWNQVYRRCSFVGAHGLRSFLANPKMENKWAVAIYVPEYETQFTKDDHKKQSDTDCLCQDGCFRQKTIEEQEKIDTWEGRCQELTNIDMQQFFRAGFQQVKETVPTAKVVFIVPSSLESPMLSNEETEAVKILEPPAVSKKARSGVDEAFLRCMGKSSCMRNFFYYTIKQNEGPSAEALLAVDESQLRETMQESTRELLESNRRLLHQLEEDLTVAHEAEELPAIISGDRKRKSTEEIDKLPISKEASSTAFGSGAVAPTFGSSGGFAALAATSSPPAKTSSGFGSATSDASPFSSFATGSGVTVGSTTVPSSMVKPLFEDPKSAGDATADSPKKEQAKTPPVSSAAFGSGAVAPTFGSGGGFAALAASPPAKTFSGFGSTTSDASPFSAFATGSGGTVGSTSVPSSMVKPLFEDPRSTTQTAREKFRKVEHHLRGIERVVEERNAEILDKTRLAILEQFNNAVVDAREEIDSLNAEVREEISCFLGSGATIQGSHVLHVCAQNRVPEFIDMLLEAVPVSETLNVLNGLDRDGMTPLMCAARADESFDASLVETIKKLLHLGADKDIVDRAGETALGKFRKQKRSVIDSRNTFGRDSDDEEGAAFEPQIEALLLPSGGATQASSLESPMLSNEETEAVKILEPPAVSKKARSGVDEAFLRCMGKSLYIRNSLFNTIKQNEGPSAEARLAVYESQLRETMQESTRELLESNRRLLHQLEEDLTVAHEAEELPAIISGDRKRKSTEEIDKLIKTQTAREKLRKVEHHLRGIGRVVEERNAEILDKTRLAMQKQFTKAVVDAREEIDSLNAEVREEISCFLGRGATIQGSHVLHVCAQNRVPEFIDMVLEAVPRSETLNVLNGLDRDGMTPLMCAARADESFDASLVETIKKLLHLGADKDIVDRAGETALGKFRKQKRSVIDSRNTFGRDSDDEEGAAFEPQIEALLLPSGGATRADDAYLDAPSSDESDEEIDFSDDSNEESDLGEDEGQ